MHIYLFQHIYQWHKLFHHLCWFHYFLPDQILRSNQQLHFSSHNIYKTAQEAVDCFKTPGQISAVDDCKTAEFTIENTAGISCSTTVQVKVSAKGCGNHDPEDITTINITITTDNKEPQVTCNLGTQEMKGTGAGVLINLNFSYTATDGVGKYTATENLKIIIEVFNTEKVVTGDEVSGHISVIYVSLFYAFLFSTRSSTGHYLFQKYEQKIMFALMEHLANVKIFPQEIMPIPCPCNGN